MKTSSPVSNTSAPIPPIADAQAAADTVRSAVQAYACGDVERAASLFEDAERLAAGTPFAARVGYNVAVFLRKTGRLADARAKLDAVLAREADMAAAWLELGLTLADLSDLDSAEGALRLASRLGADEVATHHALAMVAFRLGKWAECLAHLARLGPADQATALLVVRALFEAGRSDEAWALAGQIGQAAPECAADLLKATTRRARGGFHLSEQATAIRLGVVSESACDSPRASR